MGLRAQGKLIEKVVSGGQFDVHAPFLKTGEVLELVNSELARRLILKGHPEVTRTDFCTVTRDGIFVVRGTAKGERNRLWSTNDFARFVVMMTCLGFVSREIASELVAEAESVKDSGGFSELENLEKESVIVVTTDPETRRYVSVVCGPDYLAKAAQSEPMFALPWKWIWQCSVSLCEEAFKAKREAFFEKARRKIERRKAGKKHEQ